MSRFGIHQEVINPPLGATFIGYHREEGVASIHDPLYVTASIFESEQTTSVFVSIDNIGLLVGDTDTIREGIADRLDVSKKQITVVYTHTHSGPATAGTEPLTVAYKTILTQQAIVSAVKASEAMQPVEMGWGVTSGKLGVNRREKINGHAVMGTDPLGVTDDRIGTLLVRRADNASLVGVFVFCTAHPNVLKSDSVVLSGDYPGVARTILEQALGCPVVIVQGATGNVNAKYRGDLASLQKMAFVLSGHVLTTIPDVSFQPLTHHRIQSVIYPMRLTEVPATNELQDMATYAEQTWGVSASRWLAYVQEQSGTTLTIPLEVQLFELNEGSFSGIPMEPFCETALQIQQMRQTELAFFGGYTNGYIGYLPTAEEHPYGGYEVAINPVVYGPVTGLWMPPVPETANEIVHRIRQLYETNNPASLV
ncbi:alkaline ceramidase [Exiguobacterium sp. U13-1]|uniref:Alkaline ceramidase n=1 Tax=Exiguobacterium acetylicum TaxID=41170 RepID=A0ABX8GE86_EXIAC|nr:MULTISPECIES: alkaline ceramidase [Exiguobacterium]AOT00488.1 alkaline ceramidase [Exiguobacterium sp. U13-1]QWB31452.1 alkaline ceramidase [Exiguobacterium acetylicum]